MGQTFTISRSPSVTDTESWDDWREKVTRQLQTRQTLVSALNTIQFIATAYLLMQSLVTGYAIVNPNGGTAIPHLVFVLGPWIATFVVAMFTRFEVGLYMDMITVELYYVMGMCALSVVVSGVGLGFFAWELFQARSDFYVQSFGFLVATVVITALFVLLGILLIAAVGVFARDLNKALNYKWHPHFEDDTPMYRKAPPPPQAEEGDSENVLGNGDKGPAPRATAPAKSQIEASFQLRRTKLVKNN